MKALFILVLVALPFLLVACIDAEKTKETATSYGAAYKAGVEHSVDWTRDKIVGWEAGDGVCESADGETAAESSDCVNGLVVSS